MARSIRVLVANRPKLMRELMVSTLADEPSRSSGAADYRCGLAGELQRVLLGFFRHPFERN